MKRLTIFLTAFVLTAAAASATVATVPVSTSTPSTDGTTDANLTGDASGSTVAVSGTGNATCQDAICLAVSGTGNATAKSDCDTNDLISYCDFGYAVSGFGDANATDTAVSGFGNATGYPTAISIFGNATTCEQWSDCMAIAVFGNATGYSTVSACDSLGACIEPPTWMP